jgi:hypothetical protein
MNRKSTIASIIYIIIAFIIGIFFGLVVLGWWLWPVQWKGGSFDSISLSDQQDYLLAAVESYVHNPDGELAQKRYSALGDQKENVLSEILGNPRNSQNIDIESFANIVQVQSVAVLTTSTSAPNVPALSPLIAEKSSWLSIELNRSLWMNICLPAALLSVFLLIILLYKFFRRKRQSQKSTPPAPAAEESEVNVSTGENPGQEPIREHQFASPEVDHAQPEEYNIPDWLREVSRTSLEPSPAEVTEKPSLQLSDSDINEITNSQFVSHGTKTNLSKFNQVNQAAFIDSPASDLVVPSSLEDSNKFANESEVAHPQPESVKITPTFEETEEETFSKFSQDIALTYGINPEDANKLRAIGITAPLLLLRKGSTREGRESIEAGSGIPAMQILQWVNYIDLLRIKGLSADDARMLKIAGVELTVKLATRKPDVLHKKLVSSSKLTYTSYKPPCLEQVSDWISQANRLPVIISYS